MNRNAIRTRQGASRPHPALRKSLSSLAVSILLALGSAPHPVHAQESAIQVNIPAQPLGDALINLANRYSLELAYSPDIVAGRQAPALSGRLTADEALRQLLAGTGMEFRRAGKNVSISRSASGETTQLAPVTVTGSRPHELLPAYAGGQVATGGQVGMLGNKDVMDTPFSQISYTRKTIQDQQAQTVQDVLANDPSVISTHRSSTGSDIDYTRGFWSQAIHGSRSLNGLPGIAPLESPSTDYIERVEVLKGPSALINGMALASLGNLGGSVNLVTKKAEDEPLTQLTANYLSDSRFGAHIDIGRRFGENKELGIRFNGALSGGDTSVEAQHSKFRLGALNLDYRGQRARLSVDVAHQHHEMRATSNSLQLISAVPILSEVPKVPDNDISLAPSWQRSFARSTLGMVQGEVDILDNVTAYAAIGTQRYNEETKGGTGLTLLDDDGNASYSPGMSRYRLESVSMQGGLRANVNTGPVAHALSVNLSRAQIKRRDIYPWGDPVSVGSIYDPDFGTALPVSDVGTPQLISKTVVSSIALADTMSFLDERIQFTAGVRHQKIDATNFDRDTGRTTSNYAESAWTPAFGLVVKPWENVSLYANYVEGLQQGTIVDSAYYANGGEVFAPYVTKQYEVGVKVDWGRVTTTLAAFQVTQPSTIAIPDPDGGLPTLTLEGKQRNRGIELNAYGELTRGVRLLGGVTFLDARRKNTGNAALDGARAAGAPGFRAVIGGEWDTPFIDGLTLTGRFTYTSDSVVANNRPDLKIPSWTSVDLGARYTFNSQWASNPVTLRLSVDNVFDKSYWTQLHPQGIVVRGSPRTFRLSASIPF